MKNYAYQLTTEDCQRYEREIIATVKAKKLYLTRMVLEIMYHKELPQTDVTSFIRKLIDPEADIQQLVHSFINMYKQDQYNFVPVIEV